MGDIEQDGLHYLLARGQAPVWKHFLLGLAEELGAQMPPAELRHFFRAIGVRVAGHSPVTSAASLAAAEGLINAKLDEFGWGLMQLHDAGDRVEIVHACAPLRVAFGAAAMSWTPALLEGACGEWLRQLGADESLSLRQAGQPEGVFDVLRFELAHASHFS